MIHYLTPNTSHISDQGLSKTYDALSHIINHSSQSVICPLTCTSCWGNHMDGYGSLQGPPVNLALGDSEQILHRTISPMFEVCKPLATIVSNTLQSTLKDSLQQTWWFLVSYRCGNHATYKVIGFMFSASESGKPPQAHFLKCLDSHSICV